MNYQDRVSDSSLARRIRLLWWRLRLKLSPKQRRYAKALTKNAAETLKRLV